MLLAALQFVIVVIIAIAQDTSFDITKQLTDDLALGPSALIFVASTIVNGLLVLSAAYLIHVSLKQRLFTILLALTGIITIVLGIYTVSYPFHGLLGLSWVVISSLAMIITYKIVKSRPLRYLFAVLSIVALVSLFLMLSGVTLGLSSGAIGLLAGYPTIAGILILGLYLAFQKPDSAAKQ